MSIQSSKNYRKIRAKVLKDKGRYCFFCKVGDATTVDHIIPRSKGGKDTYSNLEPACPDCNQKKKADYLHEFKEKYYEYRGRLIRKRNLEPARFDLKI